MSYRNRYWIDAGGGWRDRRNGNRSSTGPSRKVDRRKYRVRPPAPWKAPAPRPKRKPPKPKPPVEGVLLPHSSPRDYKSTFRFFLESVDEGHPNQIITAYLILKRTDATYITANNPKGVRIFAEQYGDLRRARARVLTLADVVDSFKFDTDWIPHIRALKGASLGSTPAKGDPIRQELAHKKLGRKKRSTKKRKK